MEIADDIGNKICVVFYAYTPYQLYCSSFLAIKIKREYLHVNCILIRHEMLNKSFLFFNKEVWDEIIDWETNSYNGVDFFDFYRMNPWKWYKVLNTHINHIKSVLEKLKNIQWFFFSSGDEMLVSFIEMYFPSAVLINIGEGSASYNVNERRETRDGLEGKFKNLIKDVLVNVYNIIFNTRMNRRIFCRTIDGGDDVNFFIDIRPEMATESFCRGRTLIKISHNEMLKEMNNIFYRETIDAIPDGLRDGSAALLLTDRLSEDGFINEEIEIDFYDKVVKAFENKKTKIYLKPHPRESIDKINKIKGVTVLCDLQAVPIEVFFAVIKVKYLICIASSAAINAHDFGVASNYIMLNNLYFNTVEQKKMRVKFYGDNGGCLGDEMGVFRPDEWPELYAF